MIKHPLDEVFNVSGPVDEIDIEKEYADVPTIPSAGAQQNQVPAGPPVDHKDEDDRETDVRLDAVYNTALEAFNQQNAYTEIIEPRYAARNAEVAANFLNLALQAATAKAKVKNDRKRTNSSPGFVPFANNNGRITHNTIVASREDVIRMLAIDGESKEVK